MSELQTISIVVALSIALTLAGFIWLSSIGITLTDTKMVKVLYENREFFLSIDGVVELALLEMKETIFLE